MTNDLSHREQSLYKFWLRACKSARGEAHPVTPTEWNDQVCHLSQSGIGTEEALEYLYTTGPSFRDFLDWIPTTVKHGQPLPYSGAEPVLTVSDHAFWEENGYLVIKNAIPEAQCASARSAIWEHLDADPSIPETWYQQHPAKKGMMLAFFQHPALDANRRDGKISKIFSELYKGTETFLLVDKVSFNPPETASYSFLGSTLHWDVSLQLPIPYKLQGLLYLSHVTADDGAFHCVPGFHNKIDKWIAGLPEGVNPRAAALEDLKSVPIPGNAGDLVIWHQALPHCATANKGTTPRMVQYITYSPVTIPDNLVWI